MTRKKQAILLLTLYAAMILLAIPLHTQKGIEWNKDFYRKTKDGAFIANKDNQFSFTENGDGLLIDLKINGIQYETQFSQPQSNEYLFAFSDGTSLRLTGDYGDHILSVGGTFLPLLGDTQAKLIISDVSALHFAPYTVKKMPFYGDNEQALGEWVVYETENHHHLYSYEFWYDGRQEAYVPDIVTLTNSSTIDLYAGNNGQTIYVNAQGEALTDNDALFSFPGDDWESSMSKRSCVSLLLHGINDNVTARGHFAVFSVSVLLFLLGFAQFLFPEEMAFFGSRWQYRETPELSEAGLAVSRFTSVLLMLISVGILFLPLIVF